MVGLDTILFSGLVLGVLGLIFGLVLSLASVKFYVKVDPRVAEVEAALPGLNCAVCGVPGCAQFAEGVIEGSQPVDGCLLGGAATADEVGRIMGVEVAKGDDPGQAYMVCGGGRGRAKQKYEYIGARNCHMAAALGGGPSACTYGCIGFGDCVESCPIGIISMGDDALPIIDSAECTGCRECVRTCPKQVIALLPTGEEPVIACKSYDQGKAVKEVCSVGCISCRLCVKACPEEAISMDETGALAIIDYDKCTNCGDCIAVCPTGTILPRDTLHSVRKASESA